ncbi:hypothetical protein YC2023_082587 [Brassica napus]
MDKVKRDFEQASENNVLAYFRSIVFTLQEKAPLDSTKIKRLVLVLSNRPGRCSEYLSLIRDLTLKKGLSHHCTNKSGTGDVPLIAQGRAKPVGNDPGRGDGLVCKWHIRAMHCLPEKSS